MAQEDNYIINVLLTGTNLLSPHLQKAREEFHNFRVEASRTKEDLDKTSREVDRSGRLWGQHGRILDGVGARMGNLVARLRATNYGLGILTTSMKIMISVFYLAAAAIAAFGAELVALGASAALAAAALGGALLAGIAALLPVIGLLVAAMVRVKAVMEAVKAQEEAQKQSAEELAAHQERLRQSAQQVADAQWNLKLAHEGVRDAQIEERRATEALREARKGAARDIVDANFAEKEAVLSVRDAELALLQAKQRLNQQDQASRLAKENLKQAELQAAEARRRLALAEQQGDSAEIVGARSALDLAESNVRDIKSDLEPKARQKREDQLAVDHAKLNLEEAKVARTRATKDADEANRKGVEGSNRVRDAQRQLTLSTRNTRDAVHALTIATRSLNDALRNQKKEQADVGNAQKKANDLFKDLSPAEKRLAESIKRIKKTWDSVAGSFTDPIIDAFAKALDQFDVMLRNPRIQRAAKQLSTALGSSIVDFAKFLTSPEAIDKWIFFFQTAATALPKAEKGIEALIRLFGNIAQAATPLFLDLLDRFVDWLDRLANSSDDTERLGAFFDRAGEHLDGWIEFFAAAGNFFGAIIGGPIAERGRKTLEGITEQLNSWADWIRKHPKEVKKFFDDMHDLAKLVYRVLVLIVDIFGKSLKILKPIVSLINTLLDIPVVGEVLKWGAAFTFVWLVWGDLLKKGIELIRWIITTMIPALGRLGAKIYEDVALRFLYAIDAMKKFAGFLLTQAIAAVRLFGTVVRTQMRLIVGAAGIGLLILAIVLIIEHWDKVKAAAIRVWSFIRDHVIAPFVDFVRQHWKLLLAILMAPFLLTAAPFLAVIKFRDKIIDFFKALVGAIGRVFDTIVSTIKNKITGVTDWVSNKVKGIKKFFGFGGGDDLVKTAASKLITEGHAPKGAFRQILDIAPKGEVRKLRKDGLSDGEIISKLLEEDKIDPEDIIRVFKKLGVDEKARGGPIRGFAGGGFITRKDLLGAQSGLGTSYSTRTEPTGHPGPIGVGQAVPIIAHVGEWILNKTQQAKLAMQSFGGSVQKMKDFLFGAGPGAEAIDAAQVTDPYGKQVSFIPLPNGQFANVSKADYKHYMDSGGRWIPKYIQKFINNLGGVQKMALGGSVMARPFGQTSFAAGGVVTRGLGQQGVAPTRNIAQHFTINTQQVEADVPYIMRTAQIMVESAF